MNRELISRLVNKNRMTSVPEKRIYLKAKGHLAWPVKPPVKKNPGIKGGNGDKV